MARPVMEIGAHYADRQKAFGQKNHQFERVYFKVAESLNRIDVARALVRGMRAQQLHLFLFPIIPVTIHAVEYFPSMVCVWFLTSSHQQGDTVQSHDPRTGHKRNFVHN